MPTLRMLFASTDARGRLARALRFRLRTCAACPARPQAPRRSAHVNHWQAAPLPCPRRSAALTSFILAESMMSAGLTACMALTLSIRSCMAPETHFACCSRRTFLLKRMALAWHSAAHVFATSGPRRWRSAVPTAPRMASASSSWAAPRGSSAAAK
eukprot:3778208-Pyramimonas_sp.AAC.2